MNKKEFQTMNRYKITYNGKTLLYDTLWEGLLNIEHLDWFDIVSQTLEKNGKWIGNFESSECIITVEDITKEI